MKTLLMLLLLPGLAGAVTCPKGSSEWRGECVVDLLPYSGTPVVPSDELPPNDKMPSYQRDGIKIVDAPNMAFEDAKADREKAEAIASGKKAAGIK